MATSVQGMAMSVQRLASVVLPDRFEWTVTDNNNKKKGHYADFLIAENGCAYC